MSACDSLGSFGSNEDDPDVELGRFEMVLSGSISDTLQGLAVFSTTTVEDPSANEHNLFGLAFMPDTSEMEANRSSWFASQIMRLSERPAEGEYEFATLDGNHFPEDPFDFPDDAFAFSFQTEDTSRTAVMTSDEGTFTITTSSSSRTAGTFSAEVSGLYYESGMQEPGEGSMTIEGKFNALGGELPQQY